METESERRDGAGAGGEAGCLLLLSQPPYPDCSPAPESPVPSGHGLCSCWTLRPPPARGSSDPGVELLGQGWIPRGPRTPLSVVVQGTLGGLGRIPGCTHLMPVTRVPWGSCRITPRRTPLCLRLAGLRQEVRALRRAGPPPPDAHRREALPLPALLQALHPQRPPDQARAPPPRLPPGTAPAPGRPQHLAQRLAALQPGQQPRAQPRAQPGPLRPVGPSPARPAAPLLGLGTEHQQTACCPQPGAGHGPTAPVPDGRPGCGWSSGAVAGARVCK
uniref:Uncharacterized protein n=2 Tax=Mustela putorius furo TaxID=9669 RepID=M3Y7Z1_MUSPF